MARVDLSELSKLSIQEKECFIDEFYAKIAFSPVGIMYSMHRIERSVIRPFTAEEFEGYALPDFQMWGEGREITGADYYGNENSITASGLYLAAQSNKYRATGEKGAYENACRAFGSLRKIFQLNAGTPNEGFMCKPYRNQRSGQTSGDQYIHASLGLFEFYPIADEATRALIREMGVAFADYWISRDYVLSYQSRHWDMKQDHYSYNAVMTALSVLAYYYSGNERYLGEAKKLFAQARWPYRTKIDDLREEFACILERLGRGEKVSKGMFQDNFADQFSDEEFLMWESTCLSQFIAISADLIHRICPDLFNLDMDGIMSRWLSLFQYGIDDECAPYYWYCLNIKTNQWRTVGKTGLVPPEQWPFHYKMMGYCNEMRWGDPLSRFMYLSVLAGIYCRDGSEKLSVAKNIMEHMDEHRIRWLFDFDGEQLLPDCRHLYNMLSSENPATFVLSYWKAQNEGLVL